MLADDEPEVLRSIQRTLDWEKYGFSVVGAFLNGLDVLEFLENHDVDIVFTDIRMAGRTVHPLKCQPGAGT